VSITIFAPVIAGSPRICRHASMPSIRGMSMSRKTSRGPSRRAACTLSSPSLASCRSNAETPSSVVRMSLRMNGSSSTISPARCSVIG